MLLCKRPALGHGKQRLAAGIGAEAAYVIAQGLLDCALEDLQQWPGRRVLAPDHAQHHGWATALAPDADCLAQAEGNLGQRINALDQHLRAQGHTALVYIGSDAPALCEADYQTVREALQQSDVVLLDAADGGVVLMACAKPWPNLSALPWSAPALADALASVCRNAGLSVWRTGEYFDVDQQADLPVLQQALRTDSRAARQALLSILNQQLQSSHD